MKGYDKANQNLLVQNQVLWQASELVVLHL
jgi:hypothetical protein